MAAVDTVEVPDRDISAPGPFGDLPVAVNLDHRSQVLHLLAVRSPGAAPGRASLSPRSVRPVNPAPRPRPDSTRSVPPPRSAAMIGAIRESFSTNSEGFMDFLILG